MTIALDDRAFALTFVGDRRWRLAKAMPENPHEYTVRRWRADPQGMAEFNRFVTLLRDHGWVGSFGGSSDTCLDVGAHSYWMMGAPLSITVIINRKLTQHVPGEHPTSATITRGAYTASECLRRAGWAPAWTHPAGVRTVARGAVACNPQFSVGRIPAVSLAVALRPREC